MLMLNGRHFPELTGIPDSVFRSGSRAASIVVIVFASLAAVAIGITVTLKTFEPELKSVEVEAKIVEAETVSTSRPISHESAAVAEEAIISDEPILFEDAS